MSELFHCNECSKYKPIESKCVDLPCCEKCRKDLLAGDVANDTKKVKKTRVNHLEAKTQKGLSVKMYEREMTNIIFDDWMND